MLFGCEQPFLWGERCVTSQKPAAKETNTVPEIKKRSTFVTTFGRRFPFFTLRDQLVARQKKIVGG